MADTPTAHREITLPVNDRKVQRLVPVRRLLVDFLRDGLGHTSAHAGCEHGIFGTCTVLIDGEPARSRITLAVLADGTEVTTVEGITPDDHLSPVKQAFKDCHGLHAVCAQRDSSCRCPPADPDDHPTTPRFANRCLKTSAAARNTSTSSTPSTKPGAALPAERPVQVTWPPDPTSVLRSADTRRGRGRPRTRC